MSRPALLIIDMQNDFVRESGPLPVPGAAGIIPNLQKVLGEFRTRNLPVFHIVRVHRPDGSDVEINRQDLFRKTPFAVAGSEGVRIIDELNPLPGEYIVEKVRMSAFLGTELDLMLRTLGVTSVVVAGVQTPNCIRTTVFDAVASNFPAALVDDATGARSIEIHRANVRDMENIGVRILSTAGVPAFLDGLSRT